MATPAIVADFFPTSYALVRRHAPWAWDALFRHSEQHCPPLVLQPPFLGAPAIRNASLLPLALLGALAGFHAASQSGSPKLALWQRAFLCFAGMNLSAVACHSLLPQGASLHAFARALDVAFTGAAAVCLLLASLWRGVPATVLQRRNAALASWLIAGGAVCILANCLPGGRWPMVNELAYIVTTLSAVAVLGVREMARPGLTSSQRFWVVTAGAAAVIGTQGPLLDGVLCSVAGSWFSGAHLIFLGCDVAVYALGQYLRMGGAGVSSVMQRRARAVGTPQRQQPARRAKAAAAAAAIAGQ